MNILAFSSPLKTIPLLSLLFAIVAGPRTFAQSSDWLQVIWREPQVRYLLADMTLNGGKTDLYRKYAAEERDPDSREAIRLWDAGVRVANKDDFERKWLENAAGKDGRVLRIVHRGTKRTITGAEVVLTNDGAVSQSALRLALLDLTLGADMAGYEARKFDVAVSEALRRWTDGCRASNAHVFTASGDGAARKVVFKSSGLPADGARVTLNSDVPFPEVNVRYFMADIALGGSIEFYRKAAEAAHEMGCAEAVRRTEEGYTITNVADFERKQVNGKTLITPKGSDQRISGLTVKLSSDPP